MVARDGLPAILLRATICAICLLVPTTLMGASLPAVATWIGRAREGISWLGLLYAGKHVGSRVVAAGFFLLRVFDMAIATYFAAAINIAVAAIGFGLVKRTPIPAALEAPRQGVLRPAHISGRYTSRLSGACALGAEVWTRLLGLMLGATVYTLAVFLVGLAIGSGAASFLPLAVRPQTALGCCQLLLRRGHCMDRLHARQVSSVLADRSELSTSAWFTFQVDVSRGGPSGQGHFFGEPRFRWRWRPWHGTMTDPARAVEKSTRPTWGRGDCWSAGIQHVADSPDCMCKPNAR